MCNLSARIIQVARPTPCQPPPGALRALGFELLALPSAAASSFSALSRTISEALSGTPNYCSALNRVHLGLTEHPPPLTLPMSHEIRKLVSPNPTAPVLEVKGDFNEEWNYRASCGGRGGLPEAVRA